MIYYAWCVVSLLKITSIHDLLKFSKEYKLIIETITQIVPLLGDLFIQLLLLVLFYGVLGVHFFGGLINSGTKAEYKEVLGDPLEDNYEYLSFNDIPNGILLLYSILITNDWSRLMTMSIVTLKGGSKVFWGRAFFLSFFGLGFMLVLNTTIGAIIDFINTYLSILREAEDENALKEAEGMNVVQIGSDLLYTLRNKNSQTKSKKQTTTENFMDGEKRKRTASLIAIN